MIQLNKLTHLQSNKELKITFPRRLNFPKYHKAQLVFLSDFFLFNEIGMKNVIIPASNQGLRREEAMRESFISQL